MGLRKVRDEDEARCLLAEAEMMGMSRASWARTRGVDPRSLNAWRLNLERQGGSEDVEEPVRLVELVPSSPAEAEGPAYVVRCGRFEVEVDERFDDDTLRRLLRVVAWC
jgi:transposase-like protein